MLIERGAIMPGFKMLGHSDSQFLLTDQFLLKKNGIAPESILSFPPNKNLANEIKYIFQPANPLAKESLPRVILFSSIAAGNLSSEFLEILKRLSETHFKQNFAQVQVQKYDLIFSLTGQGSTENHITAAYANITVGMIPEVTLIDSKTTNPDRFFGSQKSNRVWAVLEAFFKSFLFNPDRDLHKVEFNDQSGSKTINVKRIITGTQSLFDGVTCGFHTVAAMNALVTLIKEGKEISGANILGKDKDGNPILGNPVRTGQALLRSKAPEKVKSNLLDFLGEAWSKTYTTSSDGNTSFFEYPSKGTAAQKVAYFIPTFRFLTAPLTNMVKLPTELVVHGVAEFFDFLQTQLNALLLTNPVFQGLRTLAVGLSFLCRGIFLGLSRVLRCVFSPVESAKEALKVEEGGTLEAKDYILCALSVVVSLSAYVAIAIFAAPLLFAALPSLSVAVAQPVIGALGSGATYLATIIGAPSVLAGLAMLGTSFLYGVRSVFDRLCFSSGPVNNENHKGGKALSPHSRLPDSSTSPEEDDDDDETIVIADPVKKRMESYTTDECKSKDPSDGTGYNAI